MSGFTLRIPRDMTVAELKEALSVLPENASIGLVEYMAQRQVIPESVDEITLPLKWSGR